MRFWRGVFLGVAIVSELSSPMSAVTPTPPDTVVLLHGLGRSAWSLKRLEWALRDAGYQVVNFNYPSRDLPIERLAEEKLGPLLLTLPVEPGTKVHFVTHSMGGIVLRCYLRKHPLPQLGRIVMLAPPSAGSEVTEHLLGTWTYRIVNGPASQQLGTNGLPATLGPAPGGNRHHRRQLLVQSPFLLLNDRTRRRQGQRRQCPTGRHDRFSHRPLQPHLADVAPGSN